MTSWEYIAGFFDGEGSITIYDDKVLNYKRCRISVGNTNESVLKEIKKFIKAGSIYQDKSMFYLVVTKHKDIIHFLESLLPYLQIKKKKAITMIKTIKAKTRFRSKYLVDWDKIKKKREEGASYSELERLCGIPKSTIWKWIRERGYKEEKWHYNYKPQGYKCRFCGLVFSIPQHLGIHIRWKHKKPRKEGNKATKRLKP